jgi:hypothetical protein
MFAQSESEGELGVLFYNVENLFDTKNDSIKNDEQFLPDGDKHWNHYRYQSKLKNISRVIFESGGYNPPFLVGLCEIENEKVIKDLLYKTGLINANYRYIHFESPDQRGIDVALLYRKDIFTPIDSNPVKVKLGDKEHFTRDILYSFGLLYDSIPIHTFVAHFPSRYGGVMKSKHKRIKAAETLKDTIQHIFKAEKYF